jgi:hypothetical protein
MRNAMHFKDYLMNEAQIRLDEDKKFFGQKVGNILTAIHDLQEDGQAVGTRKLTKLSLNIVNQIRTLLHGQWGMMEQPYLKRLQKVGVAMMKCIDDKGDLNEIISGSSDEIEAIMKDLGVPVNDFGSDLEDSGQGQ